MKTLLQVFALTLLLGATLLVATAANAAPKKVDLEYQATRNGQPFATVTESYRAENGRYKIESVTAGKGVYALFGKRVLTSEGEVTPDGLKPSHFETQQANKKILVTDFDWVANVLTMNNKGNIETAPLEKGAQDLISFSYQFMFSAVKGDDVILPITTGRNLRIYTYKVLERDLELEAPAGKFKTLHIINASTDPKADKKELWLGAENHNLPVRIVMHDENGATIEQTLSSVHVE